MLDLFGVSVPGAGRWRRYDVCAENVWLVAAVLQCGGLCAHGRAGFYDGSHNDRVLHPASKEEQIKARSPLDTEHFVLLQD